MNFMLPKPWSIEEQQYQVLSVLCQLIQMEADSCLQLSLCACDAPWLRRVQSPSSCVWTGSSDLLDHQKVVEATFWDFQDSKKP